jgi:integrase
MGARKANGEGSVYRRRDGRWAGSAFVETVSGQRKRIHVYARTRQEVHARLEDKLAEARKGVRTPDKAWTVAAYLDYWLHEVATIKDRPRTIELYESIIRLHLRPTLGSIDLAKLTVRDVQTALNRHVERTGSARTAQVMRNILRTALNRAQREELLLRNVAKLTDPPQWQRKPIRPWTAEEVARFLAVAQRHHLYPAFVMLLVYGMRRGEVLGLRWCDVDFLESRLRIRQQLQRIGKTLEQGPVKTAAGQRDLPLISLIGGELARRYVTRYAARDTADSNAPDPHQVALSARTDENLVFLSAVGTPLDPKNFVRTFQQLSTTANLPRITVHHTRHTAATLLKNLHVPVKDAQLILGHAHVTTTQQLYEHGDIAGQTKALAHLEQQLLTSGVAVSTAVNRDFSTGEGAISRALAPGGPGGTRTLDTLLKSLTLTAISSLSTSVIGHLRTRTDVNIISWVAVNCCCQTDSLQIHSGVKFSDWVIILSIVRDLEAQALATQSFPLNFISTASHPSSPDLPNPR